MQRRMIAVGSPPLAGVRKISDGRISKVMERVASSPHHSIRMIARDLNLSASRLEHLFKHHTGRCLRGHIIDARVRRAEHLLRTSELRVKEISAHVGYAHTSSFIRVFASVMGRTPQAYRRSA